jgi:hypothetical protein
MMQRRRDEMNAVKLLEAHAKIVAAGLEAELDMLRAETKSVHFERGYDEGKLDGDSYQVGFDDGVEADRLREAGWNTANEADDGDDWDSERRENADFENAEG